LPMILIWYPSHESMWSVRALHVLLTGAAASVWLLLWQLRSNKGRFSMRTLLTAMTYIAVLIGGFGMLRSLLQGDGR
jgi:hypothetical protein